MPAIEACRQEVIGVGQEFIDIERDKGAFIQQDASQIQERIREAAGVAVHLGTLLRDIMSDLYKADGPAREFDERTARATEHLQTIIDGSGTLSELLSIIPRGENVVDVRHDHRDSHGNRSGNVLLSYAMKAAAIGKGLEAMNGRITDDTQEKDVKLSLNIRRVERTVERTIARL